MLSLLAGYDRSDLKGTLTNWSDIVILLKLKLMQEECLTGWKMK